MKFLERIGLQKRKKEQEEVIAVAPIAQPKQSAMSRISNIMSALNKPMGGGLGLNPNPKRTLRERQLGIPEYVSPYDRKKNFIPMSKEVPKAKKIITNWRPTPGKRSMKGEEAKW